MKLKTVMFFTVFLVFICCIGAASAADNATDDYASVDSDDGGAVEQTDDEGVVEQTDDSPAEVISSQSDEEPPVQQSDEIPLEDAEPKSSKVSVNASSWDEIKSYAEKTDADYVINLVEGKKITIGSSDIQFRNNAEVIGNDKCYITGTAANRIPFKSTANTDLSITFKNLVFKDINCQMIMQLQTKGISIVENCTFKSITAGTGHHSLIYNNLGVMNITGCKFTDSSAGFGVVTNHNSASTTNIIMNVRDCYFANNYGSTEPGAINNCGILTVYNSTFEKNRAYWWAGAIHTHNFANTTIYDSNFNDNVAGWNGGALYTYSYLRIFNSSFVGNNCTTNAGGGCIGACSNGGSNPDILIVGCLFKDNNNINSGGAGGAIAVMDSGAFKVYNTTFIHNSAAHGTAISGAAAAGYGSPTLVISGNTFINHTRAEDVLRITLSGSNGLIENNTFINNAIPASELYLNVSEAVDKKVNVSIIYSLKNPGYYDSDILDKCTYDIYVDGEYYDTINKTTFTLNFEDIAECRVYAVPSIYSGQTPEVTITVPRDFIYVSQSNGNDENNGITETTPVKTIAQAIKLAKSNENILLMDGVFSEENLVVNYRLTIWGTNMSSIGGQTLADSMFNVKNAKFSLRNLTINNINGADDSRLVKGESSRVYLDNCIVKDNAINTLIESQVLGITGSVFENNKLSIQANNLTVEGSIFSNNTVNSDAAFFTSLSAEDCNIIDSIFSDNYGLKAGLISYSSASGTLKIESTLFENNTGEGLSSVIVISDAAKLNIISSIIKNNDANIAVIYKNGAQSAIDIKNTIILNDGVIIDGDSSNIDCNYNWWGNTFENKNVRPNLNSQIPLDNWLFLNMDYPSEVEVDQNYTIKVALNTVISKDGEVSTYSDYKLPVLALTVTVSNVTADKESFIIGNGLNQIIFALTGFNNGFVAITYENITATANVQFTKTNPVREITASEILVGENGTVEIEFPADLTGNVTVRISDFNETKEIQDSKVKFNIEGLTAGTYVLTINFTGDKKYQAFEDVLNYTVNKHDSTTKITMGEVVVSQDVLVTVEVNKDATGNITLTVNGEDHPLSIEEGKVTYTIKNISRGDWIISAVYGGDDKYSASGDYIKFGVDKYDAEVIINLADIEYGQDAFVEIIMNNDASGNITLFLDDINKTAQVTGGKANFTLSGLTAGYKVVKMEYSGDRYYNEANYTSTFYVEKIETQFNITAAGAKEGKPIIVTLTIPDGVTGKFTITVGNITGEVEIPADGIATWTNSDLAVGDYDVFATYTGDNYLTCKNSTTVSVSAWDEPQWADDNGGKSPYKSDVNGKINLTANTKDAISGNIVIDSEGNLYIITSSGIYSFDKDGKARWNFSSGANTFSGLTIGRDVIVAPVSGDTIYFINQTSGAKYSFANIWTASSKFAPVIDEKANIYVAGEKNEETGHYNLVVVPYKLWEVADGAVLIDIGTSAPIAAPVLVSDDIVCVATEEGLKIVDVSEKSLISSLNVVTTARPVAGDGNIIYAIANNAIFAIDGEGNQLWKADASIKDAKYLALDNENAVLYAVDSQNKLYKYDLLNSGNETLVSDIGITSGILIGDNVVYAGVGSALVAIESDGKIAWKAETGDTIIGSPVMDKNGVLYVAGSNNLFAFTGNALMDANVNMPTTNIQYGADAKITIKLAEDATGDVIVSINGNNYTGVINNGIVDIPIPNWNVSSYVANITYSGDKRYSSSNLLQEFNIIKAETPSSELDISKAAYGNNPEFSINLPSDATGKLIVSVDGVNYTADLVNGSASVKVPKLSTGTHNIVVSYTGDDKYAPVSNTQKITVYPIKLTENKNVVMDYNGGSSYKVRVYGNDGKIIVGAAVTFKINKKSYKRYTDKKGYAVLKLNEIPKKYTITASYAGVTVKNTVKVNQILKSKNYKVKKSAKKLVLKATLKSSKGKALKGKVIKFKFRGKTYKAKTNKKGIAKVTIKKKVIKKLKVNKKYALKITYLKDTIKKTVKVKK